MCPQKNKVVSPDIFVKTSHAYVLSPLMICLVSSLSSQSAYRRVTTNCCITNDTMSRWCDLHVGWLGQKYKQSHYISYCFAFDYLATWRHLTVDGTGYTVTTRYTQLSISPFARFTRHITVHNKQGSLTLRLLMSYIYIYIYIYGAPILDVSRSHTTTQHSR